MFGQGRFDILLFDRIMVQADDVQLLLSAFATTQAMIAQGGDTHETAFIASAVQGTQQGAAGVRIAASLGGTVRASPGGYALYRDTTRIPAAIRSAARLSENARINPEMRGAFGAFALASADVLPSGDCIAETLGAAALSVDHRARPAAFLAQWDAQLATIRFSVSYATFDLTIPPGSSLVVDSNGYVALLDGENALHAHHGDWLRLSRDTYDVRFEPLQGEGTPDARILYQERWL